MAEKSGVSCGGERRGERDGKAMQGNRSGRLVYIEIGPG